MMMRFLNLLAVAVFFVCILSRSAYSQDTIIPPKREFRGVWVATVANIDWPSKPGLPTHTQKDELIRLLNDHKKQGLNAIVLQVRPATDALYGKGRELWSWYLTGEQGKAPNPYYDPLEFAITEAHKRGMELHAWFNPYRGTSNSKVSSEHITHQKPEWFFSYGGKKLFNPGIPEVREYIVQIIMDVVRNYDVDAIHFDDYFYPYPEKNQMIRDTEAFILYGKEFNDIHDWRRNNVDVLIKTLSDSIHAAKKYVKFGISPFGIWRNKAQDPDGSETSGLDAYRELYGDSRKWVQQGWVDYINPQVYFPFFYRAAPYERLVDWWSNTANGKHVYIGHGAYRAVENKEGWRSRTQLPDQIRYLRQNTRVQGSVFFSSASLRKNLAGFADSLTNDFYKHPALPPQMVWLDDVPPQAPLPVKVSRNPAKHLVLSWQEPLRARDGETASGYVVYRFAEGETNNIQNPKNILKISFDASETTFVDETASPGIKYTYTVTALDRVKNESVPANFVDLTIGGTYSSSSETENVSP